MLCTVMSHGDKIRYKSDQTLQTHYATKVMKRKAFLLAGAKLISPFVWFVYIITLVDWSTFYLYLFVYIQDSSCSTMAPRKLRKKSNSINTSTGTRQSKRLLDQNENILDSPKKLCYNPSSSSLEKRDLQYCKAIEKQSVPKLKSLRVYSVDEDDEDEFCGFIQEDVEDHGLLTRYGVWQAIGVNQSCGIYL